MESDHIKEPFGYFDLYGDQNIYALPIMLALEVLGRLLSLIDPELVKLLNLEWGLGPQVYILSDRENHETLKIAIDEFQNNSEAFPLSQFLKAQAEMDTEFLLIAISPIVDELTYVIVKAKGRNQKGTVTDIQHLKGTFLAMLNDNAFLQSGQAIPEQKKRLLGHEFISPYLNKDI